MRFVIRADDEKRNWMVAKNCLRALCQVVKDTGKDHQVDISEFKPGKTPRQNRTLWMWHTEIASQLTERCKQNGHDVEWSRQDVHDLIFKPRFMPTVEKKTPEGKVHYRPMNTSEKDCTKEIIIGAMEKYLAWIYSQGMEVTIPIDPELEAMCRRMET